MKFWCLLGSVVAAAAGSLIVGCGGSMFRSAKTIHDPLSVNGRYTRVQLVLGGDALTRQLSVDTPRPPSDPSQALLHYPFGNNINLTQYEGMETLILNQAVRLRFSFSPNTGMPNTITLRNVSLRVWLKVTDVDSEENWRTSVPVELSYHGTLTLERQPDGNYVLQNALPLSARLSKADGWYLLTILASEAENVLSADLSFAAETAATNIPPNAVANLTIEFTSGSAYIQW